MVYTWLPFIIELEFYLLRTKLCYTVYRCSAASGLPDGTLCFIFLIRLYQENCYWSTDKGKTLIALNDDDSM